MDTYLFTCFVFDLEWTEAAFEMHCFKEDDSSWSSGVVLNLLRLLFHHFRQGALATKHTI
jgi:hypothetical protein